MLPGTGIDFLFFILFSIFGNKFAFMRMRYMVMYTLLILSICSCNKPNGNDDGPTIFWYSPLVVSNGTEVTLNGINFGDNAATINIQIDAMTVSANALISSGEVKFTMPFGTVTSGSKTVRVSVSVSGRQSNVVEIVVTFQFHGWKYIAEDAPFGCNSYGNKLYFLNESIGYLFSSGCSKVTSDSGKNWGDVIMGGFNNGTFSVYNDRYFWVQANNPAGNNDMLHWDYGAPSSSFTYFDTLTTIPGLRNKSITGMYQTGQHSGSIITNEGRIFRLNNGYAAANITMEYEPSYSTISTSNPFAGSLSAVDANNLMYIANPIIGGTFVPTIVHKKNGTYVEYNMATLFGSSSLSTLQMVDASTAYANEQATGRMYKYSNGAWQQLPAFAWVSRFCFLNKDVGYAVPIRVITPDYSKIYKTINGGQTWTIDIELRGVQPYVTSLYAKGNRLWVTGKYNTTPTSNSFLLTYIP
jgi:IPT/TIG domain